MRRRAIAGLAVALLLVGLLVYGVGWEEVVANIGRADPSLLAAALLAGATLLVLRGYVVRRLLDPVEGNARGTPFVAAFLAGYFARSSLPWGRSTGTPITAYLLASNSDSSFEDNLAVVATAEVFGFVASMVVALTGLALYTRSVGTPADLGVTLALVGAASLLALGMAFVLIRQGTARELLVGLASHLESVTAGISWIPLEAGDLEDRIANFFTTLEAVSAARRTLAVAFAIALCSWLANAAALSFGLFALGVDAPVALALACAPLASFAGVIPLPGGTGGIEVALAGLLVALGPVSGDVATAATLLYRLATYWLPLTIGGIGALYLSISGQHWNRV